MLVVYGHAARGAQAAGLYPDEHQFEVVDSIIYSFHMPLFFFLSGLFFVGSVRKRGTIGFIANKLDTLFYPYVIWTLMQGSIEILLNRWTNNHATVADVAQFLWYPRAQLWFLYALLVVSILAALLLKNAKRSVSGWLVLVAAAAFLAREHNLGVPAVNYVLTYFGFFLMGAYFQASKLAEQLYARRRALLVPCALAFVLAQVTFHFVFGLNYETGGVSALVLAVLSIATVVVVCMVLAERRRPVLVLVGSASLVIYLFHILITGGSRIVLARFLHLANLPVILATGTVLGVLIPLAIFVRSEKLGLQFLFTAPPALSLEALVQRRMSQTGQSASRDVA